MRYADTVVLKYIDKTQKHYDPDLGRMVGGKEWSKTVPCNVTGASLDLLNANSIVVRFRSPIKDGIDTIEYNGSKYKPVTVRSYLTGLNVIYANKGADGRTPYVHFAYADSADGRTGFSLTQTGSKRYLGVYTDFNQADSTNPSDYTWNDTAGSISVGGRNLLNGSKGPFKPDSKPTDFDNYVYYENETSVYLEQNKKYIISAKTDGNFSDSHNPYADSDNVVLMLFGGGILKIISDSNTGTTGTQFIWDHPTGTYHLRVNTYHKEAIKSVWEVKIEEGTVKTEKVVK